MEKISLDDIEDVVVIGAGSMGHGIAQVFATAEYSVTLVDVSEEVLGNALDNIEESLERLEGDPQAILDQISITTNRPAGLQGADLMIEAVPENIEIKESVFIDADEHLPDHAILATNTSSLPISEIASATDRPEQVVGMHFSNPVPLMPIVEVIRGEKTRSDVFELAENLSESVGKTPVLVKKDVPGFILNRINYSFWSEALRRVDDQDFKPEIIDAAVQRLGFPMGPFEVLDFAGLDVYYMVCKSMGERGVPVAISPTHEELVEAEKYGLKTGEGFYEYPEPGKYTRVEIPLKNRYEYDPYNMIASATNACAWLLDNDIASKEDIDRAMEIGMNWPRGPLKFTDEFGIDRIVDRLDNLYSKTGRKQYEPHQLLKEMVGDDRLGTMVGEGFYEYTYTREQYGVFMYERRADFAVISPSNDRGHGQTGDSSAWNDLGDALERTHEEDDIHALILQNLGEVLTSDTRLREAQKWKTVADGTEYFEEVVLPVIKRLRNQSLPVVNVNEGDVTGPSSELLLFCDLVVMNTGARIALLEASAGVLPPFWIAHDWKIHNKTLFETAITDIELSSEEAKIAGIINHAVPENQAADVAWELARLTTGSSLESISKLKDLGRESDVDFDARISDTITAVSELALAEYSKME